MGNALFSARQFVEGKLDWQYAVKLACRPLEAQGYVSDGYAQAIITATENSGPWYVLSPTFALPHARPEEGVLSPHSHLSLLYSAEPIPFPDNPEIRLVVVLAAANSDQHIRMIQRLVCWLDENERLTTLASAPYREGRNLLSNDC